tara:strand:- start:56 stop:292 length:237 start_codon:yes stop_codon:yes gene_type:complete
MNTLPQKKGFRIKNVVYSNSDGSLTFTTLSKLTDDTDKFVSSYYRTTSCSTGCSHECDDDEEDGEDEPEGKPQLIFYL